MFLSGFCFYSKFIHSFCYTFYALFYYLRGGEGKTETGIMVSGTFIYTEWSSAYEGHLFLDRLLEKIIRIDFREIKPVEESAFRFNPGYTSWFKMFSKAFLHSITFDPIVINYGWKVFIEVSFFAVFSYQ